MSVAKRPREDETLDGNQDEEASLSGAWAQMKEKGPTLFKSLAAYVADVKATSGDPCELMASVYYKNAVLENQYVCPDEFDNFEVKRGEKGEITTISDNSDNCLSHEALQKMLVYTAMFQRGMRKVIMITHDDSRVEVLAIPKGVQLIQGSKSKAAQDVTGARTLLTHRSVQTVYAPPESLMDLLSLGYVGMSDVQNLMKALNSLSAKESIQAMGLNRLTDAKVINEMLDDTEAKASKKNFLQTLLATRIMTMSDSEKMTFFCQKPTFVLANQLELRLPHSGPVYSKLGNKPATRVSLDDLGDDDDVLLCTNTLSLRDYQDVRGDILAYPVFKNSDELGGRRRNKFAEMKVKFTQKASILKLALTAISKSNEPVKRAPVTVATVSAKVSKNQKSINLD